jgi:hypothetical protein
MATDLSRDSEVLQPVGYEFSAYDGGYRPFEYWDQVPIPGTHCPQCYSTLDHDLVPEKVTVRGRSDVYCVWGHLVVTERFREFCLRGGYDDIEFPCVEKRRPLYQLRPTRVLDVDIERSEPQFGDFCTRCGNFESYIFGRGLFLRDVAEPLPDGFYRTDLVFGCRAGKFPTIVVGPETREKIIAERFSRVRFTALPMIDPEFETRKRRGTEAEMRRQRELRAGLPWRLKGSR